MRERSVYLVLFVAASALALLKIFLVARALAPEAFGRYTLLLIVAAILSYINSMGIYEAFLVRLNPDRTAADERALFRDSGLIASGILSLLTSSAALVALGQLWGWVSSTGFVAGGLFLVLTNMLNGMMVEIQADRKPVEYAGCLAAKSLLPVAVLLFGYGSEVVDILLLDVMLMALIVGYLIWRRGLPSLSNFSMSRVQELIRQGGAFTANAAVLNLANNLDKWAVGLALGSASLGIYAFSAQLVAIGMAFASMVQIYMYPRIVSEEHADTSRLVRRSWRLAGGSALVSGPGILGLAIAGFFTIPVHLPQYAEALPLLPVFGAAAVVIAANHSEIVFRLTDRGKAYLAIQVAVLAGTLAGYGVLYVVGAPVYNYALVFVAGRIAHAAIGYGYVGGRVSRTGASDSE